MEISSSSSGVRIVTAPLVNVRVTSNVNNFTAEKRFDRGLTIADLKGRLEMMTGGSAGNMSLQVFDTSELLVDTLTGDTTLLGAFCVEENYRIHVTDTTRKLGEFEDLSQVEKYELPEEEYNKRGDSVRSFLQKNRLGKYNAEELKQKQQEKEQQEQEEETKAKTITVGRRCEVTAGGEPTRRGEVAFVGGVHFKPGVWVGVRYDEPLGKNDGSIGGHTYFKAPMKYGGFTRPSCCTVGQYPPMDEEEEGEVDEM